MKKLMLAAAATAAALGLSGCVTVPPDFSAHDLAWRQAFDQCWYRGNSGTAEEYLTFSAPSACISAGDTADAAEASQRERKAAEIAAGGGPTAYAAQRRNKDLGEIYNACEQGAIALPIYADENGALYHETCGDYIAGLRRTVPPSLWR